MTPPGFARRIAGDDPWKSSRRQGVTGQRASTGRAALPPLIVAYVRWVEAVGRFFGRICMYLVFVMIGILLYSAFMRTGFNRPPLWTVEMAQFLLTAYYILGGAWTLQARQPRPHGPALRALAAAKARLRRHDHRRSA